MVIKFLKSPIALGYAHRAGETNASLPDDVKTMLIGKGFAIEVPDEKPQRTPPKVVAPKVKPATNTAVKPKKATTAKTTKK